jgi:sugar phosphate isomerase/epimerase
MIDRRLFIKASTSVAVGSIFSIGCSDSTPIDVASGGGEAATARRSLDRIGVQLYSVRYLLEQDFPGTLEAVANAGFEEVEFHSYFGNSPAEVRAMLDGLGLSAPATHVSLVRLREDLAGVIAEAKTVGHKYIISPWLAEDERGTIDSYRQLATSFNEWGQACREEGLVFGWHNHAFELAETDGEIPLDVLIEETDPGLVTFELDLFWAIVGGHDPLDYFERYPGRFALCHVKDMAADGSMVDVGAGTIDFSAIFDKSEQAGLVHYFVEHDEPEDALASITASHDYLATLTY